MTLREAVIQAWVELGMSREVAELRARFSNVFIPDAAGLTESPVKPGCEQQFIAELKMIFRRIGANPKAVQGALRSEMGKRTKKN